MTYRGHIKNGVVVLESGTVLPEGTPVVIEAVAAISGATSKSDSAETLGKRLMKFAGKAKDLPSDASRNHDHYLYGTPKR